MREELRRLRDLCIEWIADGLGSRPAPEPRAVPAERFQRFEGLPAAPSDRSLGQAGTILVVHPAPARGRTDALRVMTFNIYMGGRRRQALLEYFRELEEGGRTPDVIGVQEANQEMAAELAQRYGFHLVYFGSSGDGDGRLINGKAILTRHPIVEAKHYTYRVDGEVRSAAKERHENVGELEENRGALHAAISFAGREVAVYNVHHTLSDPGINASDLLQLSGVLRQEHRPTVVLGDFNTNTLITRDGSWPLAHLRRYDATHTVEEYQARYGTELWSSVGDEGVGNSADARVRRGLRWLRRRHPDVFGRAERVWVRLPDGTLQAPSDARRRLRSGGVPKESEAWRRLQDVADTATLTSEPDEHGVQPATGKRFDCLYTSRTLKPRTVEVDRSTRASDHQPVITELSFS